MRGNWRGHVVTCALLAFFCAWLAYTAFRLNSWGKWQKSATLANCLSLPPPFGCADLYNTREVLSHRETDFGLICVICCVIYIWVAMLCLSMLAAAENAKIFGMDRTTVTNSILKSFMVSAVLSVIICLIAAFRISAVYQTNMESCVYDVGGYLPVYSVSFYIVSAMGFLSIMASLIATSVCQIDGGDVSITSQLPDEADSAWAWDELQPYKKEIKSKSKASSRTTKQHIARNLLYPDDPQLNKMITFSSMTPEMEEAAADVCMKAVTKFSLEEDIAENVKLAFEAQFGPTWQCAVGDHFGSCVHHRSAEYVEVAMPRFSVLLYRCIETPNNRMAATASPSMSPESR